MNLSTYLNNIIKEFPIYESLGLEPYGLEGANLENESYIDFHYEEFLDSHYSTLPMNRVILDYDESDFYTIYEYYYSSPNKLYKVLLSAGMHGVEIGGVLGLTSFLKEVFESEEEGFRWIRENVDLSVIPILNPWGIEASPLNYGNSNEVNINKNIRWRGLEEYHDSFYEKNGWGYAGNLDHPEAETKILLDWVDKHQDSNLYIDCHTAINRTTGKYSRGTLLYGFCTHDIINKITKLSGDVVKYYSERFLIEHPGEYKAVNNSTIKSMKFNQEYSIPCLTIEQQVSYKECGWSGRNGCDEAVRNYVLMLRYFMLNLLR